MEKSFFFLSIFFYFSLHATEIQSEYLFQDRFESSSVEMVETHTSGEVVERSENLLRGEWLWKLGSSSLPNQHRVHTHCRWKRHCPVCRKVRVCQPYNEVRKAYGKLYFYVRKPDLRGLDTWAINRIKNAIISCGREAGTASVITAAITQNVGAGLSMFKPSFNNCISRKRRQFNRDLARRLSFSYGFRVRKKFTCWSRHC